MSKATLPTTPSYESEARDLCRIMRLCPTDDDAVRLVQLQMEMAHAKGAVQVLAFLRTSPDFALSSAN